MGLGGVYNCVTWKSNTKLISQRTITETYVLSSYKAHSEQILLLQNFKQFRINLCRCHPRKTLQQMANCSTITRLDTLVVLDTSSELLCALLFWTIDLRYFYVCYFINRLERYIYYIKSKSRVWNSGQLHTAQIIQPQNYSMIKTLETLLGTSKHNRNQRYTSKLTIRVVPIDGNLPWW